MSYPRLRHHGYCHSGHDLLDELWVGHAGNTALGSNIGGDTLEGHNGAGTSLLCYPGLVRCKSWMVGEQRGFNSELPVQH